MGRNCSRGQRAQKLRGLITFVPFVQGGGGGSKALGMPRAQRMRKGRGVGSSREAGVTEKLTLEVGAIGAANVGPA